LTLSTISLANVVLKDDELEKQYFEIIKQYKKPEKLAELLSITTLALEEKTQDFLGEVYMFGDFGNKNNGQFFTPYHISQFMSEIVFDERTAKQTIEEQGFIKLSEPCCGAGGMILGFAETMLKYDLNPQKQMVFQGVDIDINCCRMSFIQTSLMGLTGEIIHGDTIALNCWYTFVTPMTILNMNNYLKFREPLKENIQEEKQTQFITKDCVQLKLI
jgi:type I restriction-modification system DNA methylase subunit